MRTAHPLIDPAALFATLTVGGWITMLLSVGFVVGLFAWCIWRVMKAPPPGQAPRLAHVEPIERDEADRR
jgi:hypothetical protein